MKTYTVKISEISFLTPKVKRFVVEKPSGYFYKPGQATDIAIYKPGLETELRAFTFTSHPNDDYLEFIVKIYTGQGGFTEKLSLLHVGDELIIHEVFGEIAYKGPGLFMAGGTGITPVIAILRDLKLKNELAGNSLLFANRAEADIILKEELQELLGDACIHVLSNPLSPEAKGQYIDAQLLLSNIHPDAYYYLCGPATFQEKIMASLKSLGVETTKIIIEH